MTSGHGTDDPSAATQLAQALRARWPSLLGLVMIAASSFRGADVYVVTLVTMLAALIYLTAAAVARRRAAWITFVITGAIVPVGVLTRVDVTIPLVIVAAALVGYGLINLDRQGRRELMIQALGFAGFAAISAIALQVGPAVAAYLAAFAVIGHGGWDVLHHRRDQVVPRSYAEFCAVLDVGIGVLLLMVTWLAALR